MKLLKNLIDITVNQGVIGSNPISGATATDFNLKLPKYNWWTGC